MNPNEQQQKSHDKVTFKCSDTGLKYCDWQVSGNSEQELMPKIERHVPEIHGLAINDYTRNRLRDAVNRQAA